MSRHYHKTSTSNGVPVQVAAGWDRPLQTYFLTIFACKSSNEESVEEKESEEVAKEDVILYDNNEDFSLSPFQSVDWTYLEKKLAEFGVSIPEDMKEHILADEGNPDAGKICMAWD